MSLRHYNFSVIVERDTNGYFASCPELQGCYSQGHTYEETIENIKDAVKLHVEDRLEKHEEITQDHSVSLSTVEVAV